MSIRELVLTALFAIVALSVSSSAEAVCFAGPNCPRMFCESCIPEGGGEPACCEVVQWTAKCTCIAPPGSWYCHTSGTCSYATCLIADGTGPCIWNAPPTSRRWATVRAKVHPPRAS